MRSGSDDTTLGSAFLGDRDDPRFAHTRLEESLDQIENTAVSDARPHAGHHHLMVEPVEKGGDVGIHDVPIACLRVPDHGGDGMVRLTPLSEPETPVRHVRVEQGIEHLEESLLHHAVGDNGNGTFILLIPQRAFGFVA